VKALASELEHSTSAIIGTFTGLTAAKDFELRKTIRAAGGRYHVVKNKLAAKSAQGTKVEKALQGLKGVSSVAYTSGDPVALAKALSNWVKDNAEFTFKLGIVDGKVINVTEIQSSGDGHQRDRPQPGCGGEPGGRAEQVRRWCRGSGGKGRSYARACCREDRGRSTCHRDSQGGGCRGGEGRSDRSRRAC
jgi:hypothetical protein